jgi:hypothetical protein
LEDRVRQTDLTLKTKTMEANTPILVIGCNYHTKWQKSKGMRFVLAEIKGDRARLETRNTNKNFWTNVSDLIFIETGHNFKKASKLSKQTNSPQ